MVSIYSCVCFCLAMKRNIAQCEQTFDTLSGKASWSRHNVLLNVLLLVQHYEDQHSQSLLAYCRPLISKQSVTWERTDHRQCSFTEQQLFLG